MAKADRFAKGMRQEAEVFGFLNKPPLENMFIDLRGGDGERKKERNTDVREEH